MAKACGGRYYCLPGVAAGSGPQLGGVVTAEVAAAAEQGQPSAGNAGLYSS